MAHNLLGQRIGIIGGGQLGKMMILEAKKIGFTVSIIDPTPNCPAHSISDKHIIADYDDEQAVEELAKCSDVITYEFEHIGLTALEKLENRGFKVFPTIKSLRIIQNKYIQKRTLENDNIKVPKFNSVKTIDDIKQYANQFGFPLILKTCTGGYDGKGNAIIKCETDIDKQFNLLGAGQIPLMIEEFINFTKEISVLACRAIDGSIIVYPVGENHHKNSILDETIVPADISETVTKNAKDLAYKVMEVFSGVGMFCVEMFVTEDDDIYINEVAPRPHNSGHYTIEGCYTSQFEQHIRAITGLPFGNVDLICPTVMKNIIGEIKEGKATYDGIEEALSLQGVKVHIYGKEIVKLNRKMGHITVCDQNIQNALTKARQARESIKI